MLKVVALCLISLYFSSSSFAYEQTFEDVFQACLFKTIKTTGNNQTLQQIKDDCEKNNH